MLYLAGNKSCITSGAKSTEYAYIDPVKGTLVIGPCHSTCTKCKGSNEDDCTSCSEYKSLVNGICTDCFHPEGHFYLEGKECKEKCGKGKILSNRIECDDGNTKDGDGCNS